MFFKRKNPEKLKNILRIIPLLKSESEFGMLLISG